MSNYRPGCRILARDQPAVVHHLDDERCWCVVGASDVPQPFDRSDLASLEVEEEPLPPHGVRIVSSRPTARRLSDGESASFRVRGQAVPQGALPGFEVEGLSADDPRFRTTERAIRQEFYATAGGFTTQTRLYFSRVRPEVLGWGWRVDVLDVSGRGSR